MLNVRFLALQQTAYLIVEEFLTIVQTVSYQVNRYLILKVHTAVQRALLPQLINYIFMMIIHKQ